MPEWTRARVTAAGLLVTILLTGCGSVRSDRAPESEPSSVPPAPSEGFGGVRDGGPGHLACPHSDGSSGDACAPAVSVK